MIHVRALIQCLAYKTYIIKWLVLAYVRVSGVFSQLPFIIVLCCHHQASYGGSDGFAACEHHHGSRRKVHENRSQSIRRKDKLRGPSWGVFLSDLRSLLYCNQNEKAQHPLFSRLQPIMETEYQRPFLQEPKCSPMGRRHPWAVGLCTGRFCIVSQASERRL